MSNIYKALRQAELENEVQYAAPDAAGLNGEFFAVAGDEVSWLEDAPLLHPAARPESRLVAIGDSSLAAEKFRVLRTRLRHMQNKQELKTIVITSTAPGEGKTMIASNLALSLARNTSQRVLLLEGDLRHPALPQQFGVADLQGITDWFESSDFLTRFVWRVDGVKLWFLPAGKPSADALRILHSTKFTDALKQLAPAFDWVIIDAPPLVPLADVHVLGENADGLILVIRQGRAPKKELVKGLGGLDGTKVLGVVLNDIETAQPGYYNEYYRYEARGRKNGSEKKVVQ